MDKKLQNKLYKKYPNIFKQRKLPMSQTCMCWGISCSRGWANIIDRICSILEIVNPEIEFIQIKEKFGLLAIYADNTNENGRFLLECAESMSGNTCEICGEYGKIRDLPWILTLCDDCYSKNKSHIMKSLPIGSTPILKGKEAKDFTKKEKANRNKVVSNKTIREALKSVKKLFTK